MQDDIEFSDMSRLKQVADLVKNRLRIKPAELILASQSPRRKQLLAQAGYRFEVYPAHIKETVEPGWTPDECAWKLAKQKARHVVREISKARSRSCDEAVVLAADTVVALGDKIFGKPKSDSHAYEMLWSLSRSVHQVITGVCLWPLRERLLVKPLVDWEITYVKMRPMTEAELREYIASGEGRDKAGGYAIQETADRFIDSIDGEYDNVVGLPMRLVKNLLDRCNSLM